MISIRDRDCGTEISINGSTAEILSELTMIIKQIREMMSEQYGEEEADRMITRCGKLAYMTAEEVHEEVEKTRQHTQDLLRDILAEVKGEDE